MSWSSSLCNYSTRCNASRTDFSVCNDSKKLNQTMVGNAFSREKKREFGGSNLIGVDGCSYSLWDAHLLAPCYRPLLLQSCLAAPVCLLVPGGDRPAICLCQRLACCRVQTCTASLYRLLQCCSPCNIAPALVAPPPCCACVMLQGHTPSTSCSSEAWPSLC